jgi:putative transposase
VVYAIGVFFPMENTSMAMGRPKAELVLSEEEQAQLQSIARSRSLPAALVRRAHMVLACAAGATNTAVARRFATTNATVGKWRRRFVARRIEGLHDELRPGKPRSIDDERIAELLNTTLHARPKDGATHWSVRGLAAETGIAKTSVHRFLQAFGLQPHRRDSFKLSTDPFFIEKLRDVVGLYLNPPDKALVLCLDKKSQIQALERTQPLLPLGFGYVEGVTHDYLRHGTTTLFAALDLLDGTVLAQCRPRTGTRNSLASCAQSTKPCRPTSRSTSSSTTTPPTSIPRSRPGSRRGRAGTSISSRPTARGSIWSSASSP